jgi:hypothetical protein
MLPEASMSPAITFFLVMDVSTYGILKREYYNVSSIKY